MNNVKPNLKGKVDFIDYVISRRMRLQRIKQGFSQFQLADVLNVSIQQIQKYESGINRISGGKSHKIAKFLKVPINYFFDNINESKVINSEPYPINEKEFISLISAFNSIKNHRVRKQIIEMTKIMASRC